MSGCPTAQENLHCAFLLSILIVIASRKFLCNPNHQAAVKVNGRSGEIVVDP